MQTNKLIVGFLLVGTFVVYAVYTQESTKVVTAPVIVTDTRNTVPATIPSKVDPVTISPTPTPVVKDPVPTPVVRPTPTPKPVVQYRDGTYTGDSVDVYYGNVQVAAIIQDGKLTDVQFLDYPQDRSRSVSISSYAVPGLITEAIQAQGASVSGVSGATATSEGFVQSLTSALAQAKI